jgi:hypothetical protein
VWRALGLDGFINQALEVDRSGMILAEILRDTKTKLPILGQVGLKETVAVAAWYIWWKRQ